MGKRLLGDSAGQNINSAANNSFTLTLDHLAQLVSSSGPTGVSSADYVRDCVQASEHARILLCSQTHLVVRLGPDRSGGVVLAYDLTLPPKPQEDWTAAPVLTGRTVCGRGVTGSRPMLASALACILNANLRDLKHPIYLALQGPGAHDPLPQAEAIRATGKRPRLILSAQATDMQPVNAHPGQARFRTHAFGSRGRALPPWSGSNASDAVIRYGAELLELRSALMLRAGRATLALGQVISEPGGGSMPFKASIEWGVSYWASSDLAFVLDSLEKHCRDTLEPGMQSLDASAGLALERLDDLPPLRPSPAARQACNGILKREPGPMEINGPSGIWNVLGAPVIAIGPGAPAAAYDPVETISLRQIMACTALMRRVATALS